MRKTTLILIIFFFSINLFSQDSLLKTFKYRIDHYRAISFNGGGGTGWSQENFAVGKATNSGSSGGFTVAYYGITSTDKRLFTVSCLIGSGLSSASAKYPNEKNNSRSFSVSPVLNLSNKWFRNTSFIELGIDLSGNLQQSRYTNNGQINPALIGKIKLADYNAAITLGIGKGRLENVTNMQNALWLYKDLQDEQRLTRALTPDELNELGQAITFANNTRVLDARRRTRFILETTDQFFQQKNVLTATDIKYFSSLNDILFFAFNQQRLTGTEFYVRVTPAISQARNDQINDPFGTDYKGRFDTKSILLAAGISRYKPVSLRHQNNYGISLGLSYISDYESNKHFSGGSLVSQNNYNPNLRQGDVNLFFEHAIYPNTRTALNFSLDSKAGYQDIGTQSEFFGMATLSANVNYFVSYRTRLTCTLGANYSKNTYAFTYYHALTFLPDNVQLFANAGVQVDL
jgi:hypothetical protein